MLRGRQIEKNKNQAKKNATGTKCKEEREIKH